MISQTLKNKIDNAVKLYIDVFGYEYTVFLGEIKAYRENLVDKYATLDKGKHAIERELYRLPENLHNLIQENTNEADQKTMRTKEYAYWFGKRFPQFLVTKEI